MLGKKKQDRKIDWVSKAVYPKKEKNLQEYPKLSSVIFGSSIPSNFFEKRQEPTPHMMVSNYQQQESTFEPGFGLDTKYSIKYINAEFQK